MDNLELPKIEVISCISQKDWVMEVLEAGADAIYCGLQNTSWYNINIEFSWKQLIEISQTTLKKNKKLYLAINRNLSLKDINEIISYLPLFENKTFNGIILSDWGCVKAIRQRSTEVEIHLSANTGCVNVWDFELAKELKINRIIFSPTVSLRWIKYLVNKYEFEWEAISYGSHCINEVQHCPCYLKNEIERKNFFCNNKYCISNEDTRGTWVQDNFLRFGNKHLTGKIALKYFELGIYHWKIEGRGKSISHVIKGTKVLRSLANSLFLNKDGFKSTYSSSQTL